MNLTEAGKVHTIRNDKIAPRGAPDVPARAFDKPGTNRSVAAAKKENTYFAMDSSDEGEYIMCLVLRNDSEDVGTKDVYRDDETGVNVLFYKNGKIEGVTDDRRSDTAWRQDRDVIIQTAREGIGRKYLNNFIDKKKMNESKLTFKQFLVLEVDSKVGWYVEKDDKTIAGPMSEQAAIKLCADKGGDAEGYTTSYVSDYDASRVVEGKSPIPAKPKLNVKPSKPAKKFFDAMQTAYAAHKVADKEGAKQALLAAQMNLQAMIPTDVQNCGAAFNDYKRLSKVYNIVKEQ